MDSKAGDELQPLEGALRAALYRIECPAPEQLMRLYWRQLAAAERTTVAEHLERCPLCAAEYAQVAQLATAPLPTEPKGTADTPPARKGQMPPPKHMLQALRLRVAQLLPPAAPTLAYGALRGGENAPGLYAFEGGLVSIATRAVAEARVTVHGQVLLSDPSIFLETYRLLPQATAETPQSGPLDAAGAFVTAPLALGAYQLFLLGPAHRVAILQLSLA